MRKLFQRLGASALALLLSTSLALATIGFSTAVRNAMLDAIESTIGTSAIIRIYAGSAPATCGSPGTVLAEITLASDWMSAASAGAKALSGLPVTDTSANATGTAAYFQVFASNGSTCGMQGTVTATGGGGDMTVDNVSIASGQQFSITAFTITAGNP